MKYVPLVLMMEATSFIVLFFCSKENRYRCQWPWRTYVNRVGLDALRLLLALNIIVTALAAFVAVWFLALSKAGLI